MQEGERRNATVAGQAVYRGKEKERGVKTDVEIGDLCTAVRPTPKILASPQKFTHAAPAECISFV